MEKGNKSLKILVIGDYSPRQTKELIEIKNKISKVCFTSFTSVLLNLYRNGKDSNGWHADDEPELGINPVIASVSFGEERFFQLKHKTKKIETIKKFGLSTMSMGYMVNDENPIIWRGLMVMKAINEMIEKV